MFHCVKILLNAKSTQKEIADHLNISETTVKRIKQSESWEDYKNILAAINLSQKERNQKKKEAALKAEEKKPEPKPEQKPEPEPQVVEHRQSVTVQTTHFTTQKLDEIINLLKTMSAKVACIIDDLYGTKGDSK